MSKEEKQPWNPFPLHALNARKKFGLTSTATAVLIYLAARSNYTGWTCVGQDRIKDDLGRSKDYVTRAMKELRDKNVILTKSRGRKLKQADSCLLSQEILPASLRCDPDKREDICDPDPGCNPASQEENEKCNPDFENVILTEGAKPYSIEPTESQTLNLADQLVSKSAGSVSLRSTSTAADAATSLTSKNGQEHPDLPSKADLPPVWEVPCYRPLHDAFGSYAMLPEQDIRDIDEIVLYLGWEPSELGALVSWCQKHRFWSRRIVSARALAQAMSKAILVEEDGGLGEKSLPAQFARARIAMHQPIKYRQPVAKAAACGFDVNEGDE